MVLMVHDELLAIVNKYRDDVISGQIWTTEIFIKALSAVVELHKPNHCSHGVGCLECGGMECASGYPCPTIQAIEKAICIER